jgi:hypothetical protein
VGWYRSGVISEAREFVHLRIIAVFLTCAALMGAGTQSAFALPQPAGASTSVTAPAGAPAAAGSTQVSAADTARAGQLLGITPPSQVAFVPVCYYVYRYAYVCSGGRCAYVYRYVYVCN